MTINRRNFLQLAAGGAAVGFFPSLAKADYCSLTYTMHGDGWDNYGRRQIVAAAMDLAGNMSYDSVMTRAYRLSGTAYHLTGDTWNRTNPNSYYEGFGYKDVLWVQMANLDNAPQRPQVNIYGYYSETFDWGKANYDLVSVKFSPAGFHMEGEFSISLNHYYLGGGGFHSSPAAWASVIVHEMLHNLGHMHESGDYRNSVQINAMQQAVYEAGRGSESHVAARHFRCGGRV